MNELKFYIKYELDTFELKHSPDGWDDGVLNIERSPQFLGVVRAYSIELKFMLDGAKILRNVFYYKVQRQANLIIEKLNKITLQYEPLFTGIFDFSTFKDEDFSVQISVIDNSLADYIKRNMDKEYTVNFVASGDFYLRFPAPGNPAVNPMKFVYFRTVFRSLMDAVTEGRVLSGEFALDDLKIKHDRRYPSVITSSYSMQGGAFNNINLSLKEMLKTLFVLYKVVLAIQLVDGVQTLILKDIEDTFPAVCAFEFGEVSDLQITLNKDFLFDSIAVGYPAPESEDIIVNASGISSENEFGITVNYSNNSAVTVKAELELTTAFRADNTGILQCTADYGYPDESVNDIYIVVLKNEQPISSILAMDFGLVRRQESPIEWDNAYNVRISPKRLLLKHQRYIDSMYYGIYATVDFLNVPGAKYFRITQDQIGDLATTEYEHTGYGRSSVPYFAPITFDFEALLPEIYTVNGIDYSFNFEALNQVENLRFKFYYKGAAYEGFLMSMKVNVSGRRNKAVVRLVAVQGTNFLELIR